MKRVGVTQRLDTFEDYGEVRNCLDQRWIDLLLHNNFCPVPLPCIPTNYITNYLDTMNLDAMILSGGGSIEADVATHNSDQANRGHFEFALLTEAINRNIPVLGVCRGLQVINCFFGGTLSTVENHVACEHEVTHVSVYKDKLPNIVTSFHEIGIKADDLAQPLIPISFDDDRNVEAAIHKFKNIAGVMWHPERMANNSFPELFLMKDRPNGDSINTSSR